MLRKTEEDDTLPLEDAVVQLKEEAEEERKSRYRKTGSQGAGGGIW